MSRHPSVQEKLQFFTYDHLPPELQETSRIICEAMTKIINDNPKDSSQLTLGLQHLIDAKDCFVRAKKLHVDSR